MLPSDSKACRAALAKSLSQTLVDDHYAVQQPRDKLIPYSDELFKEVAIQWLIATDQVIFFSSLDNLC